MCVSVWVTIASNLENFGGLRRLTNGTVTCPHTAPDGNSRGCKSVETWRVTTSGKSMHVAWALIGDFCWEETRQKGTFCGLIVRK